MVNGRRLMRDARDVTHHVIAGLATALSGALVTVCENIINASMIFYQQLRLPA